MGAGGGGGGYSGGSGCSQAGGGGGSFIAADAESLIMESGFNADHGLVVITKLCTYDYCGVCGGNNSTCGQSGDVNLDGDLDILDVITLILMILPGNDWNDGIPPIQMQLDAGDLNQDGVIDVLDIVILVNEILEQ